MLAIGLLIAATVLFLLSAFDADRSGRAIPAGLACLAGAILIGHL